MDNNHANKITIIKRVYRTLIRQLMSGTDVSSGKGMFLDIVDSFEIKDAEDEWGYVLSGRLKETVVEVILRDTPWDKPETYSFIQQSFIAYLNKYETKEVVLKDLESLHQEICSFLKMGSLKNGPKSIENKRPCDRELRS